MAINPLLFNQKATFGTYGVGEYDDNGNQVETFNAEFTVWCGEQRQTLNQQYSLLGSNITDTKLIAVRHGNEFRKGMLAKIKDELFDIVNISLDETIAHDTFDLITLVHHAKL